MKKILTFALSICLMLGSVLTMACDAKTQTTLANIGEKIGPLADVFNTEFNNLVASGVIKADVGEKVNKLNLVPKAKDIGDFIKGVGTVTASNKDEVLAKLKEGTDLLSQGILQLPPGSKAAKILAGISGALDAARLAVILINTPPAPKDKEASFALKADGTPTNEIKVTVKVDKTVADILSGKK